jgi:hypothetical protein
MEDLPVSKKYVVRLSDEQRREWEPKVLEDLGEAAILFLLVTTLPVSSQFLRFSLTRVLLRDKS